ncbi:MAG: amidohydrolase family protein [Acidobacteria bacterium]|nr:amidohydrolase family protein [Acidobacteriota bacterium]
MSRSWTLEVWLALCLAAAAAAAPRNRQTPPASFVIRGGTVYDGTGSSGKIADVRVRGDEIVEIGPALSAAANERAIDAIVGQDGSSVVPIAALFETVAQARPSINVATAIGHGSVREIVMGGDFKRAATSAEIDTMKAIIERGMLDGALGLSSGLEYDPGFYATPGELVALAAVAARHGGYYSSHVRDEENAAFAAWREAIDVGRRAGLPVEIAHIKLASKGMWGKAAEGLRILEGARREGLDVTADWYPYTYWQSSLYVLIPDRDFENRASWTIGLDEIGGAGNVLVTSYRPDPAYDGRTIADVAAARKTDPVTLIIEMIRAAGPNIGIIGTSMVEEDLGLFVAHPQVLICSDGGLTGRHPRGYGAFPRVLARYVRELRRLPLTEAIAKMTGRSAARAGFSDRGVLAPGRKADIVVFDPAAIQDRGTPADPAQAPLGVRDVLVNGEVVLDDGRMTEARPGRPLRRQSRARGSEPPP